MNFSEPVEAGAKSLPCGLKLLNDQNLVVRAKAGDTAAFVELGERHSTKVRRTVYRITRNWEDAEDALQESLLKGVQTSEWLRKQIQLLLVAYQNSDQFRADDFAKEEGMQRSFDRRRG